MAITDTVLEDSTFSIMARVHANGANLTQSDVSTITYSIFYTDSTTAHTASTSLTVATVIFDTLQTSDGRWTVDGTGYNFRHDVAATVLTDPTRVYQFEYLFTLADSSAFFLKSRRIVVEPVKTS